MVKLGVRSDELEVQQRVAALGGIADDRKLREKFLDESGLLGLVEKIVGGKDHFAEAVPLIWREQRRRNMQPYIDHIVGVMQREAVGPDDVSHKMKQIWEWQKKGGKLRDLRTKGALEGVDESWSSPDEATDLMLPILLRDPQEGRALMRVVDTEVEKRSEELLAEIDRLAREGKRKRLGLGIVGDGPNTSTTLTAVGAFMQTVVISRQAQLAYEWRYRPISINSSTKVVSGASAPLPLQESNTTRITPRGVVGGPVQPGELLTASSLAVEFKVQRGGRRVTRQKRFLGGQSLGRAVAMNVATHADYFLMNQEVLAEKNTKRRSRGKNINASRYADRSRERSGS